MRRKNLSAEFIKENISYALYCLMKTKKYSEISISDICKKAGYGRTTYYRYFNNNKDDLIAYLSELRWNQYKEQHPDEIKKDEGKALLNHIYNYKEFFKTLTNQSLEGLLFKIFFKIFGRSENEAEILGYGKAFFAGAYFGIIYQWIITGCVDTPEEIQKKFLEGFIYGFQQQKK